MAPGPFKLGVEGGFRNPAGTLTDPHVATPLDPFGAGDTRLDELSGFFVRFCPDFASPLFPNSKVIEFGGFPDPDPDPCGRGTRSSPLLDPSFKSIARRLGPPRFDSVPPTDPPFSPAFRSLLKQGSHTRYGFPGFGANAAFRAFFELHA